MSFTAPFAGVVYSGNRSILATWSALNNSFTLPIGTSGAFRLIVKTVANSGDTAYLGISSTTGAANLSDQDVGSGGYVADVAAGTNQAYLSVLDYNLHSLRSCLNVEAEVASLRSLQCKGGNISGLCRKLDAEYV